MYHKAKYSPLKNFIFCFEQTQIIGIQRKKLWRNLDNEDFPKKK